jgi:hypothetical protein
MMRLREAHGLGIAVVATAMLVTRNDETTSNIGVSKDKSPNPHRR